MNRRDEAKSDWHTDKGQAILGDLMEQLQPAVVSPEGIEVLPPTYNGQCLAIGDDGPDGIVLEPTRLADVRTETGAPL